MNVTVAFTDPAPADTPLPLARVFNNQIVIDEHSRNSAFTPADNGT